MDTAEVQFDDLAEEDQECLEDYDTNRTQEKIDRFKVKPLSIFRPTR